MKLFLTGTESFVGRCLIARCDEQGIEVTGCDVSPPSDNRFSQADICGDISDLIPSGVDAVVHLAALSSDPQCRNKAHECFSTNVMGTLSLMAAAERAKAKQFVFASTEWVYDTFVGDEMKTEESPIDIANHTSEYALSKLVSEQNLRQKYSHGFCPVTILRFGIIYGPREINWSAVEALADAVRTKEEVSVGSLATGRCFVHVRDIAAGILSSVGVEGFNIVNLEGERLIRLGDIIETSKQVFGRSPAIIESDSDTPSIRNVSRLKAKDLLGWEPSTSLEAGIRSLISEGT
jgi:nucleoside-diphosphate-sugar epimerase